MHAPTDKMLAVLDPRSETVGVRASDAAHHEHKEFVVHVGSHSVFFEVRLPYSALRLPIHHAGSV